MPGRGACGLRLARGSASRALLGGQALDGPAGTVAPVAKPVVQPVRYPPARTRPSRARAGSRPRNRASARSAAGGQRRSSSATRSSSSAREPRPATACWPRLRSAIPRPGVEIGLAVLHATGRDTLPSAMTWRCMACQGKTSAGPRVDRQVPALARGPVAVEGEARLVMRLQQHGAGPRAAVGGDGGEHHGGRLGQAQRRGVGHPPGELRHRVAGHRGPRTGSSGSESRCVVSMGNDPHTCSATATQIRAVEWYRWNHRSPPIARSNQPG